MIRILHLINRSFVGLHSAAFILAVMTFTSYVIAIIRDRLFAHFLGATEKLDIYVASFKLPDTLFILATSIASVYALLPVYESKSGKDKKNFIDTAFFLFSVILLIGSLLLFIISPYILEKVFTQFSGEQFKFLVDLNRILILQVILLAISTFFSSIIQLKRKFLIYALSPILYNLGIIVGIVFLYDEFGLYGLVMGVVFGALLHLSIQVPTLIHEKLVPRIIAIKESVGEVWSTFLISVPRSLGIASKKISELLILGFIGTLSEGAISTYWFADNIRNVPLAFIGISYSIASFPILTSNFVKNKLDSFKDSVITTIRYNLFFIIPISTFFAILSQPIVRILFQTGALTQNAATNINVILTWFIFSSVGVSVAFICAKAFYASRKTMNVFFVFITISILQIVFTYLITKFQEKLEFLYPVYNSFTITDTTLIPAITIVIMLTLTEIIGALTLIFMLQRHIKMSLKPIIRSFVENSIASFAFGATLYFLHKRIQSSDDLFVSIGELFGISLTGALVWFLVLYIFKNKELLSILKFIWRR